MENTTLYHVTRADGLAGIQSSGKILPASETGQRTWRSAREDEKAGNIYLAEKEQAENIALMIQRAYGGSVYILEVLADTQNLVPDEDSGAEDWRSSLTATRSCAHKGELSAWKVVREFEYDLSRDEKLDLISEMGSRGFTDEQIEQEFKARLAEGRRREGARYGRN